MLVKISQFAVLGDIGSGLDRSPERSILRNSAALNCVSVVVHQVPFLGRIEYFSGASIFFSNVGGILQLPKVIQHSFKELVIDDGQTEILHILFELSASDCVFSRGAVELLDGQNGLLHFLPNVFLVFPCILDIRMIPKIESFL